MNLKDRFHTALEAAVIIAVVVGCIAAKPYLPDRLYLGELVLLCFGMLLFQGLVRDVLLLIVSPNGGRKANLIRKSGTEVQQDSACCSFPSAKLCICVESLAGIAGIFIGVIILLISPTSVSLTGYRLPVLCSIIGITGLIVKPLVLNFQTCRFQKVSDHRAIRF